MNWKVVALSLMVVLVFGAALWLADSVDTGKFNGTRADEAKQTLVVNIEPTTHDDYLVACNEEHYREAFEQFRHFVKIDTEALSVPGGPLVIALGDHELPPELEPPKRVVIEVLKRHAPKRVVLVAHQGCLIDDTIGAWYNDPGGVRARQLAHLQQARQVILTWFPQTTVEIFYGEMIGERQMRFFPVPDDSLVSDVRLTPPNGEFKASK